MNDTLPPNLNLVCPLAMAATIAEFGGKAFHLAQMQQRAIPVLPGFVVTNSAFQQFLSVNKLQSPIADLNKQVRVTDRGSLRAASAAIRSLIINAKVPDDVVEAMLHYWRQEVGGRTLIVRSSAVGEDSVDASFAGQLDSVLNVTSAAELIDALRICWASYWTERSMFYQHQRGVELRGMGVLIQEQAKSVFSGVLFTVAPAECGPVAGTDSGCGRKMLIEYCHGLGAVLVSGEINPGRIEISRDGDEFRRLALPEQPDYVATGRQDDAPGDSTIRELAKWGLQLEQMFGGPQDVEWTVTRDGRLCLLQSRAISVPTAAIDSAGQGSFDLQSASAASVLWTNANVNENFPEPISPLLYSIASEGYYHYFRNLGVAIGLAPRRIEAMENSLRQIIGIHGARMYYNLSSIHACLRMAPYGEQLTQSFNNFVGADRVAAAGNQPDWARLQRGRLLHLAEIFRIACCVGWRSLTLSAGVAQFEKTVVQFAAATRPDDLPRKALLALRDDLRGFLAIRFDRWRDASLADAAAMLSYGMLKRVLSREFPDEDSSALHNSLLRGLPELVSNLPVTGLWELSREVLRNEPLRSLFETADSSAIMTALLRDQQFAGFQRSLSRYLEECGFRCSGELMLTVASFQENPAALIEILRGYVQLTGDSPAERLQQQAMLREAETLRVLTILKRRPLIWFLPWPTQATVARRLLHWTQRSIGLRERARMKQALLYSRCRRIVLAIGDRCVQSGVFQNPEDVFFLKYLEIDEVLSGVRNDPAAVQELVRARRQTHREQSQLNPPDTFELPEGESFTNNSLKFECAAAAMDSADLDSPHVLKGIGACGGKVTARAAILQAVDDSQLLTDGDILVTRQTDPGWGPLFFLIRGLVIERGGMLSHGAILAREFGIPTVVGVPGATTLIAHGRQLTVNGDRGIVQLGSK